MNRSLNPSQQIMIYDLQRRILTMKSEKERLIQKVSIQGIQNIEIDYNKQNELSLIRDNMDTYKVEFIDGKQKCIFIDTFWRLKLDQSDMKVNDRFRQLRLFITTYNCGESRPTLDLFNQPNGLLSDYTQYDILTIGLQECSHVEWVIFLRKYIEGYQVISSVSMWKMVIVVLVKQKYEGLISNVEVSNLPTGIAKIIGNKGAVATSFRILQTSYLFISSHLAARPNNTDLRIQNYHEIVRKIRHGNKNIECVSQFDYVFFIGDMNFRIDYKFKYVQLMSSIKNYQIIQQEDQLHKCRSDNKLFTDFNEGKIDFRPSYRRMKDNDLFSNKKEQTPSYTDRIMYRSSPNHKIEQIVYDSKELQYGSDHRPVFSVFNVFYQLPFHPTQYIVDDINPQLQIKIEQMILDYDFRLLVQDGQLKLDFPFNIRATFYSGCISETKVSYSVKVDHFNQSIKWSNNLLPTLTPTFNDQQLLQHNYVNIIFSAYSSDSEHQIGHAYIDFSQINNQSIFFIDKVRFMGRHFGDVFGGVKLISL